MGTTYNFAIASKGLDENGKFVVETNEMGRFCFGHEEHIGVDWRHWTVVVDGVGGAFVAQHQCDGDSGSRAAPP